MYKYHNIIVKHDCINTKTLYSKHDCINAWLLILPPRSQEVRSSLRKANGRTRSTWYWSAPHHSPPKQYNIVHHYCKYNNLKKKSMAQPRRGTWPCEPLAWPAPRSSLQSCWERWNLRWQAWDFEENSRTYVSQEGSSRRKRAIDSVQQNSIIGLDVDIMVAAAPGDTNHSIPAIVDEAVQAYLTVSQLYHILYIY